MLTELIAWFGVAYQDPLFWWFPVMTSVVSMVAFLLFAIPMTVIAYRDLPRFRRYRIQPRRTGQTKMLGPAIRWWVVNNAITTAVVICLWPWLRESGIHLGELPSGYVIAAQVGLFIILDDALFYAMHRLLHTRWLFRHVHAIHHRVHAPWAIAAHYMHPLEFLLISALVLAGPILLGVHVVTLWIWVIFRQYEAADGHSGYDFPGNPATLLPGYEGGLYHDYHHARVHGNYAGFFSYLDAIFGTYCRGYLQHRARLRLQRTVSRHSPL
ncbi:MAG: sterol desaturase family protein [Nannocystaceae bacterium]